MRIPFLIGRLVVGGFFLYNGINHFRNRGHMKQYVASKKVPLPDAAVLASGIALMAGGGSILLGIKPKYGAAAIVGFLAAVSPIMHDFWNAAPERQSGEMIHFMKNMALLGAVLSMLGVEEPWPVAVPVAQPGPMEKAARFVHKLAA